MAAQQLPPAIVSQVVALKVVMRPVAVHAMVLAVFASLVAPFGKQRGRCDGRGAHVGRLGLGWTALLSSGVA